MRWPSRKTTTWKTKVALIPFTLGDTTLWLATYETRKRNGVREYRIPGEPTIYMDFYA